MNKLILLIALFYFISISSLNSQTKNSDILSLGKINNISTDNLIINFISEILANNSFVNSEKFKDGKIFVRNVDSLNSIIYFENNGLLDSIHLEISENNINQKNKKDFKIKNNQFIQNFSNNFESNLNNIVLRQDAMVDKDILSGIVPHGQTRILNRERTHSFLIQQGSNQPASLFSDISDGVIIPDNSGNSAKIFIVDRNWNRIIYSNKEIVPSSGQSPFYSYGSKGEGIGEFKVPSGITYGPITSDGFRRIFVAEIGNDRVQRLEYKNANNGNIWRVNSNSIINSDLDNPYDIVYHPGNQPNHLNIEDDILWISEKGYSKKIRAINSSTGIELFQFNQIIHKNIMYEINPGRLDIYYEYNTFVPNELNKVILAVQDENSNSVFLIHFKANGCFPEFSPPTAFSRVQLQNGETLKSLKLVSLLPNTTNPVGLTLVSNDENGNGYLHFYRVAFLYNNTLWNIPNNLEYLASTNTAKKNGTSSPTFKNLLNLESQFNYVDIFTTEQWNDNYGLRRLKLGVDVQTMKIGEKYCRESGINVDIRLTSPAKVHVVTKYRPNTQTDYVICNSIVNGVNVLSNEFYLGAGNNFVKIKCGNPIIPRDLAPTEQVKIEIYLIPIDENNFHYSNSNMKTYVSEKFITDCNSNIGCPFISVFDGSSYQIDNNILHRSEFEENLGVDIKDNYLLNVLPFIDTHDSTISIKISEFSNDYSYFDQFKLVAIDHPAGTKLGITEYNDFVIYFPEISSYPCFALLNGKNNITSELQSDLQIETPDLEISDGDYVNAVYYDTCNNKRLIIKSNFNRKDFLIKKLSERKNFENKLNENITIIDSLSVILNPYISTNAPIPTPVAKRPAGSVIGYNTVNEFSTPIIYFAGRQNKSDVIIPLTSSDIMIDSTSFNWNNDVSLSYIGTNIIYYGGFIMNEFQLIDAKQNGNDVLERLIEKDQAHIEMDINSNIELKFKVNDLNIEEGWVRDYIFVSEGRYIKLENQRLTNITDNIEVPKKFDLFQNYPNPFNPLTTITFDIPYQSHISMTVIDMLGREVFKLIDNVTYNPGRHKINFNGSNLPSGIYFYTLKTNNFINTKKLVLIK